MMLKIAITSLIISTILVYNVQSQSPPSGSLDYIKNLNIVISKIKSNQKISLLKIEKTIPTTLGEYFTYYGSTSADIDEERVKAFYKLDSMIYKNAEENKLRFTRKVIFMADFVDGEYAEPYYDYLQKIVYKNKRCFCESYSKLSENSRLRLEEMYAESCKK